MTFVSRFIDLNFKYKAGKACPVCYHVQEVNSLEGTEKLICPDCKTDSDNHITCCKCKQITRAV